MDDGIHWCVYITAVTHEHKGSGYLGAAAPSNHDAVSLSSS